MPLQKVPPALVASLGIGRCSKTSPGPSLLQAENPQLSVWLHQRGALALGASCCCKLPFCIIVSHLLLHVPGKSSWLFGCRASCRACALSHLILSLPDVPLPSHCLTQLSHLQVLPLGPTLQVGLLPVPAPGKGSQWGLLSSLCSLQLSLGADIDHRKGYRVQISPLLQPVKVPGLELVFPLLRELICMPLSLPYCGTSLPWSSSPQQGTKPESARGWASFEGLEGTVSKEHL